MPQHPGDIVTVPYAEFDPVDPLIVAFGALAEEDGDPDRMVGRRLMTVDMISRILLFAHDDDAMAEPILVLEVPAGGMAMGLIEDVCDAAIQHHAAARGEGPHAPHDAWDFRRVGDAVHIRPAAGLGHHIED